MYIKPTTSPLTKPTLPPAPPPVPTTPPTSAEVKVAESREFEPGLGSKLDIFKETANMAFAKGETLNLVSGKKFREIRSEIEKPTPYTGVKKNEDGTATATDVPNPDSLDGKWAPADYMPRFVFDKAEDAFPVSPTFDGDLDYNNNGPASPGADSPYKDGVVGGKQPLSAGFAVTKKGEYTVLSYSFYYAHNKAGEFHKNDYSTAQVYLKPGESGKLEPAYLSTSWHHGSQLVPYGDLKKDGDGRPIVGVHLGSHALEIKDEVPKDGFQIAGSGDAYLNGKPIDQRLGFEAFQKNVEGATYLDPSTAGAKPRLDAMTWGEVALNPFLPEVYHNAPKSWEQILGRGVDEAKKGLEKVVDKAGDAVGAVTDKAGDAVEAVTDTAGDAVEAVTDTAESVADKAKDVGKGAVSKAKDFFSGL